ncbi:sorting nexin-15 [Sander lucioperca]|uniref:Sorting nexin 15 n=1 Tax=Sander lucioperca TaxID=283035 RepID=A0A8D0DDK4_SANLU|nr:sorting nexin-15 [Sander lucioperca]
MSRKPKDEYYRFFTVTDPRTHEKGHTEYKVSARFVSKRHPEDVKEVVVWRRFSELKKLHGELAYTHRNLFRRQEDFPSFPRAQVFGRFDEAVIEERRNAAEVMLLFTTSIPALYNSPQLKDFFRGGEVTRPLDATPLSSAGPLPPPLIPLPKRRASDCEPAEEEEGREAPTLPQDLGINLGINLGLEEGEPEVAAEAYSEMGGSPREEQEQEELSDTELDDRVPSPDPCPARNHQSEESQEEFDSLFDSVAEEQVPSSKEEGPPPLTDNDLAVFDPCYKQDKSNSSSDHSELFSLPPASLKGGDVGYLNQAATELTDAMKREKEGEFSSAIRGYRTAVDILITGVQGDPDPIRRESVMRRTAQYLKHTEMLVDRHSSPTHTHTLTHTHTHTQDP